jgi:hypothetical protein
MSRASIVAVLAAVEVAIVGVALYAMGVGRSGAAWAGMQHYDYAARPIAPIAAGDAPHVVISDPQSSVAVKVSTDGLVHVNDMTRLDGARWPTASTIPVLTATRTGDGVSIERPPHETFFLFGSSYEHIEVDVPRGSHVEIARCEGADIDGITGGVVARSQDGHINLTDIAGTVDAHSDDGSIRAHGLALTGTNSLTTDDGRIELGLAPGADLSVDASTADGKIVVNGNRVNGNDDSDAVHYTTRLGNGTGSLRASTQDGSIHITTNGA